MVAVKFNEAGRCPKGHHQGCPPGEREGRMYVEKFYDGVSKWFIVVRDQEAADRLILGEIKWLAHGEAIYMDKGLPVPPQYNAWSFKVKQG